MRTWGQPDQLCYEQCDKYNSMILCAVTFGSNNFPLTKFAAVLDLVSGKLIVPNAECVNGHWNRKWRKHHDKLTEIPNKVHFGRVSFPIQTLISWCRRSLSLTIQNRFPFDISVYFVYFLLLFFVLVESSLPNEDGEIEVGGETE